jgi:methyl-accepting chemotaxis protein
MTANQISLVQKSWQKVLHSAPQTAEIFYTTLFEMDPSLKALFPSDIVDQSKKLIVIFDSLIKLLDKPNKLTPAVQELGVKHRQLGVKPEHYDTAGAALLKTLAQGLGEDFTTLTKKAWTAVYQTQVTTIINAANNVATTQSAKGTTMSKDTKISVEQAKELQLADMLAQMEALNKVQAVIEFNMDGTIITANENFLSTVGYSLEEVQGQHHSIFVEPDFKESDEYKAFWESLNRGEFESKEYKRLGKGGKEVWIQASYNPIVDLEGNPYKVVKFATDVTQQKLNNADSSGQIEAISKAQAVIEFTMDGTIITANENFLSTLGYSLEEVQGQHHSIFVEPDFKISEEYKAFWEGLNRGEYESKEYKRLGKGGTEVWIQASYNPILDLNGKPFKVVKFATDVTAQKLINADSAGQIEAISKAQAVIEFTMDGTIITANENFLSTLGYSLEEVQGQHHSMFVEPDYKISAEYKAFWEGLNRGEFESKEYKRLGKGGIEVWIQASYNPILDLNGKPFKVVKFATDVTTQKLMNADSAGQIEAISKAQAVIEFNMEGTIIDANENFLSTVGYSLEEIQGQHHSMFVEPDFKISAEYKAFWEGLNRGEFESKEYKRLGKGGKEIWIQASYNPILDLNGKPFKVVKFATDVTQQKLKNADFSGQIEAISKAQAVIEFNMDGTIITANENFLSTVGYSLEEIQGQHHSMFVEPAFKAGVEYRLFWESLNRGEYESKEYKRLGKGGKEIWIQASYNPIMDLNGKPFKVVKFATEVTEQKLKNADYSGQIAAIGKSQAVIEFNMDGTIITANDNFLSTLGYTLNEIQGQHHSLFVDAGHKSSIEYQQFWQKLNRGEFDSGEYLRIAKGGQEVWIQASYNPILDLNGNTLKVVKYATDITGRKQAIAQIKETLMTLSEGDLTQYIETELFGEFNIIGTSINEFIDVLSNMVGDIRSASTNVFDSARELAEGNNELSHRTESQASSLEETASAMEELTSTVQQNAENASEASKLSASVMDKASNGGAVVKNAITAMSDINKSSKKIADIISVIDEIAFQTNLLALNAAVEAARAGEQGRGFAVVAAEVRNLAQRSAGAAKEIKGLINDSVEAVGQGTKLVDETGQTFSELVNAIEEVSKMIGDIDSAGKEQSAGIGEVSAAVSQMDEMTQQNAALVEEAAASSKSMEEQSQSLLDQVSFFNNGEADEQPVAVQRQGRNNPRQAAPMQRPRQTAPATRPSNVKAPRPIRSAKRPSAAVDQEWQEF